MSRWSTARGSCTWFSLLGPARVKTHKAVLFAEISLVVWNKEHSVDFDFTEWKTDAFTNQATTAGLANSLVFYTL